MHAYLTSRRVAPSRIWPALLVFIMVAAVAAFMHGEAGATSLASVDATTLSDSIDTADVREQDVPVPGTGNVSAAGVPLAAMDLGTPRIPASLLDHAFWEMNVFLPGPTVRPMLIDFWFIEMNRYGEDFVFDAPLSPSHYPSPDGLPRPRPGVVMY